MTLKLHSYPKELPINGGDLSSRIRGIIHERLLAKPNNNPTQIRANNKRDNTSSPIVVADKGKWVSKLTTSVEKYTLVEGQ